MEMGIIWRLFRPPIRVLKAQQGDGTIYDLNSHSLYSNSRWIFLYKLYTNPSFFFFISHILVPIWPGQWSLRVLPCIFLFSFCFFGRQTKYLQKINSTKTIQYLNVKWLDLSSPPISFIIIARWVNHEGEAIIIYKVYGCYFL